MTASVWSPVPTASPLLGFLASEFSPESANDFHRNSSTGTLQRRIIAVVVLPMINCRMRLCP